MTIQLRQLLADSNLGLEVVGGHAGIDRRAPIRWVHISEIPDPTPWLEGGEVLLTTGLAVRDDPELQRALIAGLDRSGCPAVGFGVGIWLDEVPQAMITEADRRGLPLFAVPYEVPFIAVTKYVSRRVFQSHYVGLQRALDLHRRVLSAVTTGGGPEEVLRVTARSIGEVEAVLFDPFGDVVALAGDTAAPSDTAALWHALPARRWDRRPVTIGGRVATVAPVHAADEVEAVLVVVSDGELDEAQLLLVEQGVTAVGIELARGLSARRTRRQAAAAIFDDALAGHCSHRELAERLAALGIDVDRPYRVLAVATTPPVAVATLCRLIEDASPDRRVVAGPAGETAHAIVQRDSGGLAEALATTARVRSLPVPRVGRSHLHDGAGGVAAGLRESAVAVAHAGDGVVDVGELGLQGLLAGVGPDVAADAFVADMLGPVLRHGDDGHGVLVDSLRAYLRHGCRPGPAAAELRIHRHTLAYRLERIAELTGRDPRSGAHLLSFGLALELLVRRGSPETKP